MNTTQTDKKIENQEQLEKIKVLIESVIYPEKLALILRCFKAETIRLLLNTNDMESCNIEWIRNGVFWIDELSEILDPYLEQEL
jgi:hypothetical protein